MYELRKIFRTQGLLYGVHSDGACPPMVRLLVLTYIWNRAWNCLVWIYSKKDTQVIGLDFFVYEIAYHKSCIYILDYLFERCKETWQCDAVISFHHQVSLYKMSSSEFVATYDILWFLILRSFTKLTETNIDQNHFCQVKVDFGSSGLT